MGYDEDAARDVVMDDAEERERERSHRSSKDSKKRRRDEKEHADSRDRERSKDRERDDLDRKDRDREKERSGRYDREKHRERDGERAKDRGKEHDHGRKDREHESSRGRERDRDREHGRSKGRDRDHDRDVERDRGKDKDREKDGERLKEREREKGRDREKEKDDRDKSRGRDREREARKGKDGDKEERVKVDGGESGSVAKKGKGDHDDGSVTVGSKDDSGKTTSTKTTSELEERLIKVKEERLRNKSDGASEILSWVSKSRRLVEKKNVEMEKAERLSKAMEEQDNILAESEDEEANERIAKDLAGVRILHGLDKVIEGGAVVLTLKDQSILADGDINEEADVLVNVEIGEQKKRDEAYRASKKKTGTYDDKFNDDMSSQKTMLPQYDDPIVDEGVTLDERGRFTGEAEKKLEELRKRIAGSSTGKAFEDLTSSGKTSSDYFTSDEMLQFKKPKKKKSLRKKEKLDLDALEAEAVAAGLGVGDLGSRNDFRRQHAKEEQERAEAETRSNAYQTAYAKAEEASKALREEQTLIVKTVEDENLVFGEDYEDLQRSLEQARHLALKKQHETAASGPQAVALLAAAYREKEDTLSSTAGEPQENKVVITEMEEFVLGLQLNEETRRPDSEDVFMDEDEVPKSVEPEIKIEASGWTKVQESIEDAIVVKGQKEEITPDEVIHEKPVGKGLAGVFNLLKERGTLNEGIDWGGRNMDKKKSKLVGIYDSDGGINDKDGKKELLDDSSRKEMRKEVRGESTRKDAQREIRIERTDEFGRIMTPKEAFRVISHKFHGKGPGKMKQEKRMKQYQEDLKMKQMKASDTPSQAMEKMREAQARLKTPYLVLSGHVKPGQTSDPRSGFATVEKDHLGSLTPMLGDRKVEHFLGIRKPDPGSMGPPPPKKPSSDSPGSMGPPPPKKPNN